MKMAGVKTSIIRKLILNFNSYEEIIKANHTELKNKFKIEDKEYNKIIGAKDISMAAEIKKLKNNKVKVINLKSSKYPERLKNISQPPVFLYYRGDIDLLSEKVIGVVGTRKATSYGKIVCEKITEELVNNEIVTVSGLALGIDSICHKKTLEAKGKTIAVVGSGLDIIYPRENHLLWKEIGEKGLIISEYGLGTPALSYHFPQRNRIIAGIAHGLLVVESKKKGGSLITAEMALDEGREVFAVPGDIFSSTSEGCNDLIKNSVAKLTIDINDIFNEYGWEIKTKKVKKFNFTGAEEKVYNALEREKTLDELVALTNYRPGELLSILMELEIKKAATAIPGGKYIRKN